VLRVQSEFLAEEQYLIVALCRELGTTLIQSHMACYTPSNMFEVCRTNHQRSLMIEITHKHSQVYTLYRISEYLGRFADGDLENIEYVIC